MFEDIIIILVAFFALLLALVLVFFMLRRRTIVPAGAVDVVIGRKGTKMYSGDPSLTGLHGFSGTTYYAFPSWMPMAGVIIKRMDLTNQNVPIKNYKTFAKGNARIVMDVTVYYRIKDVILAAQKLPGRTMSDVEESIKELVIAAVRKATTTYAVEDIIEKKQEIAGVVKVEVEADFEKWGLELINVAVVDIKDPFKADVNGNIIKDPKTGEPVFETTVIRDISNKKEAEINSLSRIEIAVRNKNATVAEADNKKESDMRTIEMMEAVGIRDQTKNQKIAQEQQKATLQEMEVHRTEKERQADIDRNVAIINAEAQKKAAIVRAEGERLAAIERAEGEKQKQALEGEGRASAEKFVGLAKADVLLAQKTAEAEGLKKLAEAQKEQQEKALRIREIEKEQVVGLALAEALKSAQIRYIGSGAPKDFLSVFTADGGLNVGAGLGNLMNGFEFVNPEAKEKFLNTLKESGIFDGLKKEELPPIIETAGKPVVAIEKAIRDELNSR